jgi:biuret amidohydrolase
MQQPMIVGKAALVVVDIQQGGAMPADEVGIAHMEGIEHRVERAERLVAASQAPPAPTCGRRFGPTRPRTTASSTS